MSQQTPDTTVQRFDDAFDGYNTDDAYLYPNLDEDMWISEDGVVLLVDSGVDTLGREIVLSEYDDAEYVRTTRVGESNTQAYGFRCEDSIHWINADIARRLATDVFDVSYQTIRAWGKTAMFEHEDKYPVLFEGPSSHYRAMVAPLLTDE